MVTVDGAPKMIDGKRFEFSFNGLSTDTKPTESFDGKTIANGSSFFMLDTQTISFYDEDADTWL